MQSLHKAAPSAPRLLLQSPAALLCLFAVIYLGIYHPLSKKLAAPGMNCPPLLLPVPLQAVEMDGKQAGSGGSACAGPQGSTGTTTALTQLLPIFSFAFTSLQIIIF